MNPGSKVVVNRKDDQTWVCKLLKSSAPGGIRTPNPQIRSLMLCPVELRARNRGQLRARMGCIKNKLSPSPFQRRSDAATAEFHDR